MRINYLILQVWAALLLVGCFSADARTQHFVESCGEKSIAVLNLADLVKGEKLTTCDYEGLRVVASSGVVLETNDRNLSTHQAGTHAGPWFLAEAIRSSGHFTDDVGPADLVYVDDYCLQLRWLAHLHSHDKAHTEAGYALSLAYDLLVQSPRWKLRDGADFIFYDAHPGFRGGWAADRIRDKYCVDFAKSTMLIPDRPMRNICPNFLKMPRIIVTPYRPNTAGQPDHDHVHLEAAKLPEERNLLLYSKATCHESSNVGKRFRWYVSQHVFAPLSSPSIQVQCTNAEYGGQHEPFEKMFDAMSRSRFCLALPGDSASTRRLSEIMLADCIPVFVGPPYHSMPFQSTVDWATAGVIFNISNYHHWLDDDFQWSLSPTEAALSPQQAKWWVPDAKVESQMIAVDDAQQILSHLELMPRHIVEAKLQYIARIRSQFAFATSLTEPPNAVNTILAEVCSSHPVTRRKSKDMIA